jgi:4a-hydroxytetrahydrobiopterin dehydratase
MTDQPWRLTHSTVDGEPLDVHGAEVTLAIEDGAVAGKAPVNRFHGSMDGAGSEISVGPLAVTRRAGPPPLMDAEQRFLAALERVTTKEEVGQRLALTGPGVDLQFQRPQIEDPMAAWLGAHGDWSVVDGALRLERSFPDFASAWAFGTRVALEAERVFHHPEIAVTWGSVVITLTTHDAGGITDKDRELAAAIDEL